MLVPTGIAHAASLIVAAANSTPEAKTRANYVCDGKDDQIESLASITRTPAFPVKFDTSPGTQTTIECFGRHSVEWLPGDYYLTKTLTIPDAADIAIRAEGTYFHYQTDEGDAVVITGMLRCRYNFGTIQTYSTGAAICDAPTRRMPALMSVVRRLGFDALRPTACVKRANFPKNRVISPVPSVPCAVRLGRYARIAGQRSPILRDGGLILPSPPLASRR